MNVGITYEIRDKNNPDLVYYGSSELSLDDRMKLHLTDFNTWKKTGKNYCSSFKILEMGNYKPTLLKIIFFTIKWELREQERKLIEYQVCVNKNIPNRSRAEWYEANKEKKLKQQTEWRESNPNYNTDYCEDNKNKIKERKANHYQKNKEKLLKQAADYQLKNKEKLKEKFECPCGGQYVYDNKSKHFKTNKHQKWLKFQTPKTI
jgi:hypothetical protein